MNIEMHNEESKLKCGQSERWGEVGLGLMRWGRYGRRGAVRGEISGDASAEPSE